MASNKKRKNSNPQTFNDIFQNFDLKEPLREFGKDVQDNLFGEAFVAPKRLNRNLTCPEYDKADVTLSWESPQRTQSFAIRFQNILPKSTLKSSEIGKAVLVVQHENGLFSKDKSENSRLMKTFLLYLNIVKMFLEKFPDNLLTHIEGSLCCGILQGDINPKAKDLTDAVCLLFLLPLKTCMMIF